MRSYVSCVVLSLYKGDGSGGACFWREGDDLVTVANPALTARVVIIVEVCPYVYVEKWGR